MGATINLPSNETESGLVFGFAPIFQSNNLQKPALHITVGHLRTRSKGAAVAPLSFATVVTERGFGEGSV